MSSIWTPTSLLFSASHPSRKILSSVVVLDLLMPPSNPALLWTTLYGTNRAYVPPPGPPPFAGNLAVTNQDNLDSAFSFVTTLNALISDSSVIASTPDLAGTFQAQGMYCRGTLQGAFRPFQLGYRADMVAGNMRLFRADNPNGTLALIASNFVGGYYGGGQPVDMHLISTPTQVQFFASAPGQTTTPTVLGTGVDVVLYPTGRIGVLDFSNPAGEVLGGWSRYQVLSMKT